MSLESIIVKLQKEYSNWKNEEDDGDEDMILNK